MKGLLLFLEVVKGLLVTGAPCGEPLQAHSPLPLPFEVGPEGFGHPPLPGGETLPLPTAPPRHRMMFREDGRSGACLHALSDNLPLRLHLRRGGGCGGDRCVRFQVDLSLCCFCGFCVEVCPEDAIRMDTGKLDFVALSREGLALDLLEKAEEKGLNR